MLRRRMRTPIIATALIVAAFILLQGCKEATIEPVLSGSIEGQVFDRDTEMPLAGASITTSPPSGAFVSDEDGTFAIEDIEPGNYTITASRRDYATNTATVSVRENATRQAVIFLEPDEEQDVAAFEAEITTWSNDVSNDSVFVNVEYRARNAGTLDIPHYEVYFRIDAGGSSFYEEVAGEDLGVGQSDVSRFRRFIESDVEADSVAIADYYFEGQIGS